METLEMCKPRKETNLNLVKLEENEQRIDSYVSRNLLQIFQDIYTDLPIIDATLLKLASRNLRQKSRIKNIFSGWRHNRR